MKRIFFIFLFASFVAAAQNTSPLVVRDFVVKSNEIIDLEQIPKYNRTDLDNNPICRIKVKSVGFEERILQKFLFVPNGIEITHMVFKDGQWCLHVSSQKNGELTIKYMGDCVFRLPYQLEPGKVYELILGIETATLVIRTVPVESEIFIDNQKVGVGEAICPISLGAEHRYKVVCNYYYTKEDVVRFDKSDRREINIELEPNFGYISVQTEPNGADVYIDDVKIGTTPYLMKKITRGEHAIELKKPGYIPFADVVTINVGDKNKDYENVKLVRDESFVDEPVVPTASVVIDKYSPNADTYKRITDTAYIKGKFSVDDKRQIYFSKGNLQFQASTKSWRFAEHQWDIIGNDNDNISSYYSGWIDLFGWGTSGFNGKHPYMTSVTETDYGNNGQNISGTKYDWGVFNSNSENGGKRWRTLTRDEWKYVLFKRQTSSGIRFAKAIVNGISGLIILPDDWNDSSYKLNKTDKSMSGFNNNEISLNDWESVFENNGAVFLPAGGLRYNTSVNYVNSIGRYWSSTSHNMYARELVFDSESCTSSDWKPLCHGYSVRLVCDVK